MHPLIYVVLIIAAIITIQAILRWCFFATQIWPKIVFLYRARYPLLIVFSPAILGLIATWQRFILYPLIVLRDESCPPSRELLLTCLGLAHNTYYLDLMSITLLSHLTVCLGFAGLRLIELHGMARFGDPTDLLGLNCSKPTLTSTPNSELPSTAWPIWKYIVLVASGLSLPLFAIYASVHDQEILANDPKIWLGGWGSSLLAVFWASAAATAIVLILIFIEIFLPGSETDPCGLLPLENLPCWPKRQAKPSPWIFRLAAWWFQGPGYTKPANPPSNGITFRSGHVQLTLLVILSLAVYGLWTAISYNDQLWTTFRWPTLWYAEMLVFLIGLLLMGFAFWLDRAGIPPTLVIGAWVSLMYIIGGTDNFYQLSPKLTPSEHTLATARIADPDVQATTHCYVKAVRDRLHAEGKQTTGSQPQQVPVHRPKLWKTLTSPAWQNFPAGPDMKRTLVLVTAAGGGIQASAWTAKVLTELDSEFEGFSESVGLVSSVSGGSVGAMYYLGHRGQRTAGMTITEANRKVINASASASLLEPVGWGAAFPDLMRNVLPGLAPKFEDRGWAIESACWNRMGFDEQDRSKDRFLMKDLRVGDLGKAFADGTIPAVVFNATAVETGQRVMISSADFSKRSANFELVDTPIDWFDFYRNPGRSENPEIVNPRVSTAARLSASFSYAAPVARPDESEIKDPKPKKVADKNEADKNEKAKAKVVQENAAVDDLDEAPERMDKPNEVHADDSADLVRQARIHLCDGGYASNSGLMSVVRAIEDLMLELAKPSIDDPGFDRILIVRIEPFPQSVAQYSKNSDGLVAQFAGPLAATANARVSTQAERDEIDAQLIGNGAQEILKRALEKRLGKLELKRPPRLAEIDRLKGRLARITTQNWMTVNSVTVRFEIEKSQSDPPLSWKLIPNAQKDIDNSWSKIKASIDNFDPQKHALRSHDETRLKVQQLSLFFKRTGGK